MRLQAPDRLAHAPPVAIVGEGHRAGRAVERRHPLDQPVREVIRVRHPARRPRERVRQRRTQRVPVGKGTVGHTGGAEQRGQQAAEKKWGRALHRREGIRSKGRFGVSSSLVQILDQPGTTQLIEPLSTRKLIRITTEYDSLHEVIKTACQLPELSPLSVQ